MNEKLHIGGVDEEQERCLRCGSPHLDTGWECTECGYDNRPHYYQAHTGADHDESR
jgi:ribosomal protein L37E